MAIQRIDRCVNRVDLGAVGMEFNDWRLTAASTLNWWADAGVDVLVEDAPRDWLAAPAPRAVAVPAEPASAAALPVDWAAFHAWRTSADAPEAGLRGVAITASGPARAEVMVLSDCPDRDDEPAGALLSGAAGRLFDRMLAAIGLSRAEVHLAAVCTRRPVAGRMPAELVERLHECARHHVGLVAPKRLLLIGDAASRALLGTEVVRARGRSQAISIDGRPLEAVATYHPRLLLERPERKADAWKDLQLLVKGWRR